MGTLSQRITNQVSSLKGLHAHLRDIHTYLEQVISGKLPVNHTIMYHLQDIFNLLPNLNVDEFIKSITVMTNDQMVVVYLASVVRTVIALHNLIGNKLQNKDLEREENKKSKDSTAAASSKDAAGSKDDKDKSTTTTAKETATGEKSDKKKGGSKSWNL